MSIYGSVIKSSVWPAVENSTKNTDCIMCSKYVTKGQSDNIQLVKHRVQISMETLAWPPLKDFRLTDDYSICLFKNILMCSIFFDRAQYFLNPLKFFWPQSKVIFYLINLHIWAWSKIFDHIKKYWTQSKRFKCNQICFWSSSKHNLMGEKEGQTS